MVVALRYVKVTLYLQPCNIIIMKGILCLSSVHSVS